MHRSGGKPPSAGSVSTSASPARLRATAGRSLSSADPYLLLPISTAYERRGSGRRTVAVAPDEGATATTTSTARHWLIRPGRALHLKLTRQPRFVPRLPNSRRPRFRRRPSTSLRCVGGGDP